MVKKKNKIPISNSTNNGKYLYFSQTSSPPRIELDNDYIHIYLLFFGIITDDIFTVMLMVLNR